MKTKQTKNKKVLIIGLDGLRPDAMNVASTPTLDKIIADGKYSWNARTEMQTISGAAWTSLLTGVHSNKHKVYGNSFRARNKDFKTIFHLIKEEWDPTIRTVAYSHWRPIITHIFENNCLDRKGSGSDEKLAKKLAKDISNDKGDFYFLQLDDIDDAGHQYVYGPNSPKYISEIEKQDRNLENVLNAIEMRPKEEDWLILVVSDHGGSGRGHGKTTIDEITIVFIVSGKSVKEKGDISKDNKDNVPEIVDVVPIIADFLGIPKKEYWDGDSWQLF